MNIQNFLCRVGAVAALVGMPLAAHADSVNYGNAGAWSLYRNAEGGRVESCHAILEIGAGKALIFDHNPEQTSIGFKGPRSSDGMESQVEVWFDNNRGESQILEMPLEGDWRVYRSSNSEPDGILDSFANRKKINFAFMVPNFGEQTVSFTLQDTNPMTKRTFDCVQNPRG